MKTIKQAISLILFLCIFGAMLSPASATEFNITKHLSKTYIKVGAGYKFKDSIKSYSRETTDYSVYGPVIRTSEYYKSSPISARFEIGYQYNKNITFGISHHSQWFAGWPVNNDKEYSKTEIFIDYTFWF
jgi:hypothetical protein